MTWQCHTCGSAVAQRPEFCSHQRLQQRNCNAHARPQPAHGAAGQHPYPLQRTPATHRQHRLQLRHTHSCCCKLQHQPVLAARRLVAHSHAARQLTERTDCSCGAITHPVTPLQAARYLVAHANTSTPASPNAPTAAASWFVFAALPHGAWSSLPHSAPASPTAPTAAAR